MEIVRIMAIQLTVWLLLTTLAIPALSQLPELPSDDMTVLDLKNPVRFIGGDGMDTEIQPGIYQVSAKSTDILQLTSPSTGAVRNLQAATIIHTEPLKTPYPFLIEESENQGQLHLVLLLPEGLGLDAIGRQESVQTRGLGDLRSSSFTPTRRYTGVLMQQGRVALDQDFNEQDAVASAENTVPSSPAIPSYGRVTLEDGRFQLDKNARRMLFRRCKTCWKSQK